MEFLVHIEICWPPDGDRAERARLGEAEVARAGELAALGVIKRLWRVPGRRANYGIWAAADASALHDAISSLPLFPWLDVDVVPLAAHPSDPDRSRPPAPGPAGR
jgi:muconolactone D-isomerase